MNLTLFYSLFIVSVAFVNAEHLRASKSDASDLRMEDIGRVFKPLVNMKDALEALKNISYVPLQHRVVSKVDAVKPLSASLSHHKGSALSFPMFTCESLPTAYDPHMLCSGVVDYPFITYDGQTLADLEALARAKAANFNSFINSGCLTDVKRLICSSVYLQCVPNVKSGDVSTYQTVEGVKVPFMAPCGSICDATTSSGTTCKGVLENLNIAPVCSSKTSMNISQYDYTSTALSTLSSTAVTSANYPVCNDLPSTKGSQVVAQINEPYVGSICTGFLTEVYAGAPSDPSIAPLLPPYVAQTIAEYTVAAVVAFMPRYAYSSCQTSFREALCTTYLMHPYPKEELASMFGTVYIPSFPSREICTSYNQKCASMIELAPSFALDCNQQAGSLYIYPEASQTIVSLDLGFAVINLDSPPYTVDESKVIAVAEQCPYGSAIPEMPEKSSNVWIAGTACAISCPAPLYSLQEMDALYEGFTYCYWICSILSIIQAINIWALKPQRRNIFVILSVVFVFLELFFWAVQLVAHDSYQTLTCDSNTSYYSRDTFDESPSSISCAVTGLIRTYIILLSNWFILPMSIEIWLRVVRGVKDVKPYRPYYFYGTLATCLAMCLANTFHPDMKMVVPAGGGWFCQWMSGDSNTQYYFMQLPSTIYFACAVVLIIHAIYTCVVVSLRVKDGGKNPMAKIWKSYSMLIMYLFAFLIIYPFFILWIGTDIAFVHNQVYVDGAVNWISCLFANFNNEADSSYLKTCGNVPPVRVTVVGQMSVVYLIYVLSCILLYITFTGDAKTFWYNTLAVFLQKTGIRSFIKGMNVPLVRVSNMSVIKRSSVVSSSITDDDCSVNSRGTIAKPRLIEDSVYGNMKRLLLGNNSSPQKGKGVHLNTIAVKKKYENVASDDEKGGNSTARDEDESEMAAGSNSHRESHKVGAVELFHITEASAAAMVIDTAQQHQHNTAGSIEDIPI